MAKKKVTARRRSAPRKSQKFGPMWADLSGDVLRKIVDMLCIEDQVSASVVCKDWHSTITRLRPMNSEDIEAWIFSYEWEKSDRTPKLNLSTQLYDPFLRKTYLVECSQWNSKANIAFGAIPCALKNGWFLFAKKMKCKSYFFLYQAYSKRRIWLPSLGHYYDVATLSKNPLSPDCVVFVSYHSGSRIYVATCGIGDEKWQTMRVDAEHPVLSVVYAEEKNEFYCIFLGGILGSFGILDQTWNFLSRHGHGIEERTHHHLLQYEGHLLLVVKNMQIDRFYIFMFDWSTMEWNVLSDIDERGATIEDFYDLFAEHLGNGAFLFMNQHYLSRDPMDYWIDPPFVAN